MGKTNSNVSLKLTIVIYNDRAVARAWQYWLRPKAHILGNIAKAIFCI